MLTMAIPEALKFWLLACSQYGLHLSARWHRQEVESLSGYSQCGGWKL